MSTVQRLNLAQKPFSNRSPRRRLRVILWTAAGLLMALNSFLFAQYWISSSSSRGELRAVRERSDEQVETMRGLQQRLAAVDLETQNEQVRFLNRKIAERTFPWSDLFDDLATVLPRDVRLLSIAPGIEDESKRRRGEDIATSIDWIGLEVIARAKRSDDVLNLIDAMFEHPSFAGPSLAQENLQEGEIEFNASVRYRVAPLLPESLDESTELVIADGDPGGAPGGDAEAPAGTASGPVSTGSRSAAREANTARSAGSTGDLGDDVPRRPEAPSSLRAGSRPTSGEPAATRAASTQSPRPATGDPDPSASPQRSAGGPEAARSAAGGVESARSPNVRAPAAGQPSEDELPVAAPDSTDAIADERYGRGQPRAPRLPNASGNNGGAR